MKKCQFLIVHFQYDGKKVLFFWHFLQKCCEEMIFVRSFATAIVPWCNWQHVCFWYRRVQVRALVGQLIKLHRKVRLFCYNKVFKQDSNEPNLIFLTPRPRPIPYNAFSGGTTDKASSNSQ